MKKIFILPLTICMWIFINGIFGFRGGYLYLAAIIVDTVFFIVLGCIVSKKTVFRILLITFSIGCSLFAGIILERYFLDRKLETFDLNHDGIFSKFEETEEQQMYFKRAINDTNILVKYVIAFPYAFIVAIVGIPVYNLIKYLLRKVVMSSNRKQRTTQTTRKSTGNNITTTGIIWGVRNW